MSSSRATRLELVVNVVAAPLATASIVQATVDGGWIRLGLSAFALFCCGWNLKHIVDRRAHVPR
ncbi:hypothetical protein [Aeromicrobium endophyticum]|uniref:hypothetical protein n=1 Tax=Aeromicrobium endophyticum TaxID=2292704 RepID=UPI0011C347CE|nr:hypothetical protein [Aeromicrobium endophyticum]